MFKNPDKNVSAALTTLSKEKQSVAASYKQPIRELLDSGNRVLLGKESRLKLALAALFTNGHLLINDLPGVGKTTMAQLLSRLLDLNFQRIQFTSDLLPADITGVSIFNRETSKFEFHPGPLFGQIILADEINRATPKSQSALLEAMEERQISVEGKTWPLPAPFFVIATQNPMEQAGTFPLPESQLDRFTLSIDLGYPNRESERKMLQNEDPRLKLVSIKPVLNSTTLSEIQHQITRVHCSEPLLDYLQAVVDYTRNNSRFITGYSPRAAMELLNVSRAWAFIDGRDSVLPEDVQKIIPSTVHHLRSSSGKINAMDDIIKNVAIP